MKLYELRGEYQELRALAQTVDEDQRQAMEDTLTGLQGEIVDKLHACCIVVRELEGEAEAIKTEEERLITRRKALEANADRLRAYMTVEMAVMEMKSVRTPLFSLALQTNKAKLVVKDEGLLDPAYIVHVPKPNNAAIRSDLEKGIKVSGAYLEPSQSVRIR